MNRAYRKDTRTRNLLFLIMGIIWMGAAFFGWQTAVRQDQNRTAVLLGKAASQSETMAEELLQLMRQPEMEEDYSAGIEFLAGEGYGSSTIRFLMPQRHEAAFTGITAVGILTLVLLLIRENRRSGKRSWENQAMIACLRQCEKESSDSGAFGEAEEILCYLPDTAVMWEAIQELLAFVRRKQQQLQLAQAEIQTNLENISHQMKTPLTGIQLYLEIVQSMTEEPTAKELLESCHIRVEQLQQMVISLLHLAKLKAGKAPMNLQRLSAAKLVSAAIGEVRAEWEQNNLSVLVELPQSIELVGDEFWTRQALINVLRNSIAHTPPGGSISIRGLEEEERAILEIEDTGSGIAAGEREKVFERFYRPEGENNKTMSGNGVGLNLARQIMERMGGSLQIRESETGTCLRFCFSARSGKNKGQV